MEEMWRKKKVIAAGHICLDITPVFPEGRADRVTDILSPGRLIQVEGADVHTGGSVANTGLAMKFLGADVSLMGKTGADAFGDLIRAILKRYGAKDQLLTAPGESTSYSVILAMPGIDRIFLHNPGANHSFCAADIPDEALRGAALLHFGYPPLMRAMYERDGEELALLMRRAKACKAATSLDMAAVDPGSLAGEADWERILEKTLPYVDFFMPSAEELCYMLDRKRFFRWRERAAGRDITEILDTEEDIRPLARRCMELGAKVLVIKCGAPGLYYQTAGEESLALAGEGAGLDAHGWADQSGFERSYVPERVRSATGAGDVSIAAFLTAMLQGRGLKDCVRLAAAAGACCVEEYDALGGLRPLDELEQKINSGWKKL